MKNNTKKYSLKKVDNVWQILDANKNPIKSHCDGEFFCKEEDVAKLLVKDFEEIEKENNFFDLRDSFVYCVTSTFINYLTLSEEDKSLFSDSRETTRNDYYTSETREVVQLFKDEELFIIELLKEYFKYSEDNFHPQHGYHLSQESLESIISWISNKITTDELLKIVEEQDAADKIKLENLKRFIEINKQPKVKIISYTVKYPSTKKDEKWVVKTFEHDDFLEAREKAIELVKKQKEKNYEYKGIQLLLNYLEKNPEGKYKKKTHKILTGNRMGTNKILPSLAIECQLLESANEIFPKMVTKVEEKEFLAVNQAYISLYYFTA